MAGLFQILPGGLFGQVQAAQAAEASAEGSGAAMTPGYGQPLTAL